MAESNVDTKSKKRTIKQIVSLQTTLKTNTTDIQKCVYAGYETVLNLYGHSITKGNPLNLEILCKERKVSVKKLKEYYFEKTGQRLQLINYNENSKIGLSKHYEKVKKARNDLLNGNATQEQIELVNNENKRIAAMKKTRETNKKKKMLKNLDKKQKGPKGKGGGRDDFMNENEENLYKGGQNLNKNNVGLNLDLSSMDLLKNHKIDSIDELKNNLPDSLLYQIMNRLNIKCNESSNEVLTSRAPPSDEYLKNYNSSN